MDDQTAAETTAARAAEYPADLVERIRAEVLESLAADAAPEEPEYRELLCTFKKWGGEGALDNLPRRLNKIMGGIGTVPKSVKHKEHGYMFSSVDDVLSAVRPLFAEHGVYHNLRVTFRDYQSFTTGSGRGVGYNGNMTYMLTLFNSDDPEELIAWEIAGLVTNPGEKLDWVAGSQFLKFGLVNALLLDRGEDADTNHGEGPTSAADAMPRRGRQSAPPPRDSQGPPPSKPAEPKPSTWDLSWERAREKRRAFRPGTETASRASIDQLLTKAAEKGWDTDMVRITMLRNLGVTPAELPALMVDGVAWIFGNMGADQHFSPPTAEELAPGGLLGPKAPDPEQGSLLTPDPATERKKK